MAGFAALSGGQVVHILDDIGLRKPRSACMTGGTFLRRSLEKSVDVARLASFIGVSTNQRETCLDMVEVARIDLRDRC
jgi:hypothetical protein